MNVLTRLLVIVVIVEAIVCGVNVGRRLLRDDPVLPPLSAIDDPLFRAELATLAGEVASGDSEPRLLAEALLGHGFYAEAELNYRWALEARPNDHAAQFSLALCLDRTGRVRESISAYRRAIELPAKASERFSRREHCLYAIGRAWLKLEQAAEAEAAFRENAGFPPAEYQLARLLVRSGRVDEAQPLIARNLERAPNSLYFNFLRYRASEAQGRADDAARAADALERSHVAVEINFNSSVIDPFNREYGLNAKSEVYRALLGRGDMDVVAKYLQGVLEQVAGLRLPQRISLLSRLAEVELQRGDPDGILAAVGELDELGVTNADTLQLKGAALSMQGDSDRAAELWLRASRMSPNVPLFEKLAAYFDQQGDAVERDACRSQAALLRAKIAYWSNEFEAAREAIGRAVEFDADNAQAWFYFGEIERQLGRSEEARRHYAACLRVDPNHGRAIRRLGEVSEGTGSGAGVENTESR